MSDVSEDKSEGRRYVTSPLTETTERDLTELEERFGVRNRALFVRMGIHAIRGFGVGELMALMLDTEHGGERCAVTPRIVVGETVKLEEPVPVRNNGQPLRGPIR